MTAPRYAIYFVPPPEGALYQFGASVLGYDCYSARQVLQPCGDELDASEWQQLTAEPRRYGFHATLKAPFRLLRGFSEADLVTELERFAARHPPCAGFAAEIRMLDGFAALVPTVPVPAIDLLAASCVRDFDRFRQPMTAGELTRRRASPLTARQIEHLDAWGYPYVFEDYRFHMTLTSRVPPDRKERVLRFLHHALKRRPVPRNVVLGSVALLRQDAPGAPFSVIRDAPLRTTQHPRRVRRDARSTPKPHSDHQARP